MSEIPSPTTPIYPLDNAITRVAFTFNWNLVSNAIGYYMVFNGGDPEDLGNVDEYQISGLEYDNTYTWQIIPYNIYGPAVDCPTWEFTVGLNMLLPVNGATNMSLTPLLEWEEVPNAIGYNLYINTRAPIDVGNTLSYKIKRADKLAYGRTYQWYTEPYFDGKIGGGGIGVEHK
jgi:hypothetical protein